MPPILASAICCVFILWLFYKNAKVSPKVSAATWIATLWVLISASMPVGAWIYGKTIDLGWSTVEEGSTIDRNVFFSMIVAGFVVLVRRRIDWGKFISENRWLLIFQLFMLASVLWSDYSFIAFKRWFRNVGSIVVILTLLTERDPVQAIRQVFVRCAYILIPLSILVMKYYMTTGVYYNTWTGEAAYCGVTTDKNALGRLAWISALFLLWSLDNAKYPGWFSKVRNRWWEMGMLVLCVAILLKSHSATSLAVLMIVATIYFGLHARWAISRPGLLAAGASAMVLLSLLFLVVPDLRKIVTGSLGRDATLTDRTEVWDEVLKLDDNPLVGVGYASFWLTRGAEQIGQRLQVNETHNGYLDTYLNTGLIGVGLLLVVLISAGRNALRHIVADSPLGPLYGALLLGGVFYNYTEAAINDSSIVGFLLWQLATWSQQPTKIIVTNRTPSNLTPDN